MKCVSCVKMNYDVEEGLLPKEELEYDLAEDALDFETQLEQAQDVKFTQQLIEPLSIGSLIVCTGTPNEDLPWFAVNIGCGNVESHQADIAVHFNVRLPQCYVVRNTRRHDKWGQEETTSFRSFPFKLNRPFKIEILIDEKSTLWAVDGEHYCSFAHRNPNPFSAAWVQVTGIRDAALEIKKTDQYPVSREPFLEIPSRSSLNAAPNMNEPIWRPNVAALLPQGIKEGHQLVVIGRLRPTLHSFAIDLLDGAQEWPHPSILLHVNVRAHDEASRARQLVVLNAWLGAWGPERRQRTAMLVPSTTATFRIVREAEEWSVFADDILIGEFGFRASPAGVKAMRVRGDIYPQHIYVCSTNSTPEKST